MSRGTIYLICENGEVMKAPQLNGRMAPYTDKTGHYCCGTLAMDMLQECDGNPRAFYDMVREFVEAWNPQCKPELKIFPIARVCSLDDPAADLSPTELEFFKEIWAVPPDAVEVSFLDWQTWYMTCDLADWSYICNKSGDEVEMCDAQGNECVIEQDGVLCMSHGEAVLRVSRGVFVNHREAEQQDVSR